jgi:hypothetical protein
MKLALTLSCCLVLFLSGCNLFPPDTCTQGDNMSNIRTPQGFDASLTTPSLEILWDVGTEKGAGLPPAYFANVKVGFATQENVKTLITTVGATAERKITVSFGNLSAYLATTKELKFTLEFPDRRGFISCTHAGMADIYLLDVTLSFDSRGQFEKATFEQRKSLGAI